MITDRTKALSRISRGPSRESKVTVQGLEGKLGFQLRYMKKKRKNAVNGNPKKSGSMIEA